MAVHTVDLIASFLDAQGLDYDRSSTNTFLVTLPGQTKLATHCALIVGDHSYRVQVAKL